MPQATLLNVQEAGSAGAATQSAVQGLTTPVGPGATFLTVVLNVGAITGTTPTLLLKVEGIDPASGSVFQLHTAFATQNAAGTYVYQLGVGATLPATSGITAVSNVIVPPVVKVTVTGGGTITRATYTVSASWN